MSDTTLLNSPSPDVIAGANVTRFTQWLNTTRGLELADYDALWHWSVDQLKDFWAAIVEYYEIDLGEGGATPVLADSSMPGAVWFPNASVSYPAHVFRKRRDEDDALIHTSEVRPEVGVWSWGRLRQETARIAAGLRALGVEKGDRVVAYMPNIPETVAAFYATASLGAVWSSAAPEFGARSVIDRFAQVEPKVLLTIDGYRYGGKDFDRAEINAKLEAEIPGLSAVIQLGYLDGAGWPEGFLGPEDIELTFERVPFDHPLWVLFSSGTTGLPKPIVQGVGGILIEQVKHQNLHVDPHPGDRFFWFTTTGWMMWNMTIGMLLTEAAVVLFDGNPSHPDNGRLWDFAEAAQMTTFGTSAAFISACMKSDVHPAQGRDLSRLRALGSTGSPLSPEGFRWAYDELGESLWLFSTSGGTDVCTPFVGGVPTLPVYLGELQARCVGVDVHAWDPEGKDLIDEVGELVIRQPMPSMPLFLWGDEDGSRLRESYFEMYPGIWRHGDWITITSRGTAIIHGRSDSTINRAGVRMGTAEIYRAVLSEPEILDALLVDLARPDTDGWMPLFVVLREGIDLDDELTARIARRIRADCSPRHVPNEVRQISAVPRTLSGKVLEIPVKRILSGAAPESTVSRESLANPEALDYFVAMAAELQV